MTADAQKHKKTQPPSFVSVGGPLVMQLQAVPYRRSSAFPYSTAVIWKHLIQRSSLLKWSVVLLFGMCCVTTIRMCKESIVISSSVSIFELAVVARLWSLVDR